MRYRITADGKYVFPHRGKPPPDIDGYKRDPGDPYILIPDFKEECNQRTFRLKVLPCGGCREVKHFYCEHFELVVTPEFCNEICFAEDNVKKAENVIRRI